MELEKIKLWVEPIVVFIVCIMTVQKCSDRKVHYAEITGIKDKLETEYTVFTTIKASNEKIFYLYKDKIIPAKDDTITHLIEKINTLENEIENGHNNINTQIELERQKIELEIEIEKLKNNRFSLSALVIQGDSRVGSLNGEIDTLRSVAAGLVVKQKYMQDECGN